MRKPLPFRAFSVKGYVQLALLVVVAASGCGASSDSAAYRDARQRWQGGFDSWKTTCSGAGDGAAGATAGDAWDDGVAVNTIMNDLTESTAWDEDFVAFDEASGALGAYQYISGQFYTGVTDVRAEYDESVGNAADMEALLASQSTVWFNAYVLEAAVACELDACWTPTVTQLLLEITYLMELSTYQTRFNSFMDRYDVYFGQYLESVGSLVSVDATDNVPPPKKSDGSSNWFSTVIDCISGAAAISVVVAPESPVTAFLTVAMGVGLLTEAAMEAGTTDDTASTASVDWYIDNSATELQLAELMVQIPGTFGNLEAVCGNQVSAVSMNWGKLHNFHTNVTMAGLVPSESELATFITDYLDGQMYFLSVQWLLPSKYAVVLKDEYTKSAPGCDLSDVTDTTYYRSMLSYEIVDTVQLDNIDGVNPCDLWKMNGYNPIVVGLADCTLTQYGWLGLISKTTSTPPADLFTQFETYAAGYTNALWGVSTLLDSIFPGCYFSANRMATPGCDTSATNGWQITSAYAGTCHYENSADTKNCYMLEPCNGGPYYPTECNTAHCGNGYWYQNAACGCDFDTEE